MKMVFLSFFASLLSVMCWGHISPESDLIYTKAWRQYEAGTKAEAIQLCKTVLDDPQTSNVDKLHFSMTAYIFTGEEEHINKFNELIQQDEKCLEEYRLYYS